MVTTIIRILMEVVAVAVEFIRVKDHDLPILLEDLSMIMDDYIVITVMADINSDIHFQHLVEVYLGDLVATHLRTMVKN